MKINKDKFNKLSQLDRIEFRQRKNEIDEKYSKGWSSTLNSLFLVIFYFLVLMITQISSLMMGSSKIINPSIWIIIIIPIAYIIDIISCVYNYKKTDDLILEYFKVEVKKK